MTAALLALTLLVPIAADREHVAMENLSNAATATQPAVRLNPPVVVAVGEPPLPPGLHGLPYAPADWDNHDRVAFYIDQWQLPSTFMYLAYRESRYRNDVRTWCCYGTWQHYISQHLRDHRAGPRIRTECEVFDVTDIYGLSPLQEQKQACVTAVIYSISGFAPWR